MKKIFVSFVLLSSFFMQNTYTDDLKTIFSIILEKDPLPKIITSHKDLFLETNKLLEEFNETAYNEISYDITFVNNILQNLSTIKKLLSIEKNRVEESIDYRIKTHEFSGIELTVSISSIKEIDTVINKIIEYINQLVNYRKLDLSLETAQALIANGIYPEDIEEFMKEIEA